MPALAQQDSFASLDEEFAHLARNEIPGFGGHFINDDGNFTVYLTDPGQRDRAVQVLSRVISRRPLRWRGRGQGPQVALARVLQGQFDFAQMKGWRERLDAQVFSLPGVLSTDIDERRNRLVIGMSDPSRRAGVDSLLAAAGIPPAAVLVQRENPVQGFVTLRERSTARGGLRIARPAGSLEAGCTLAFNTIASGRAGVHFVTNSHCTATQGGEENTQFYQPGTGSSAYLVGSEVLDPRYTALTGCPANRTCRRSDAALVRYNAGVDTAGYGYIARTTSSLGSITISDASPNFRIIGEKPYPSGGEVVDKVGQETGWTYASVQVTCKTINFWLNNADTGKSFICQDGTNLTAREGDSGAPVFALAGGNDVTLFGVLVGGDGTYVYFSAMQNIEAELGSLNTTR
ncbi:MAG TPA: hypothetical protein VGB24_17540 [Longimicrobium sp.]|jgi:hypothetical protein|uniref:hypothetical protein n=1 Tax=Longimicrobium sp. TaxID=2029185 RepID=UPI002ED8A29B